MANFFIGLLLKKVYQKLSLFLKVNNLGGTFILKIELIRDP